MAADTATGKRAARMDDRLVLALAEIEDAEESLRSARALIRELFADTLPKVADDPERRFDELMREPLDDEHDNAHDEEDDDD